MSVVNAPTKPPSTSSWIGMPSSSYRRSNSGSLPVITW